MGIKKLIGLIKDKNNPTVLGLDPKLSYVPKFIRDASYEKYGKTLVGAADAIWEFNKALIDGLCGIVPAVKPQSAYYEMYGIPGLMALEKTINYAKEKGLYVILDVKRSDIGTTAMAYSSAYLGKTEIDDVSVNAFNSDSITVNPYLGTDGIQPFIFDANIYSKSLFILVKTSNPSSGELQDLFSSGEPIYETVARMVHEWSLQALSDDVGYSAVGAVVGATYPEQAKRLRKIMEYSYFLVPGYGAQGGSAEDVAVCFNKDGLGAIVNASRSLMCAYQKGNFDERDFVEASKAEAIKMRDKIMAAL